VSVPEAGNHRVVSRVQDKIKGMKKALLSRGLLLIEDQLLIP
jgi:hypothetical protein